MTEIKILEIINYYRSIGDININIQGYKIEYIIRITKYCNEWCLFCSTNLTKTEIEFLILKEIINYAISKYKEYSITFCLSWWEPTLYSQFHDLIDYLYHNGCFIKVQTNAVLFASPLFIKKYLPYKDKIRFFVSFHSHICKVYNMLTQSTHYSKAIKWIIHLYQNFPHWSVKLNLVINKYNYNQYWEYLVFLKKVFWPFTWRIHLVFSILYPNKSNHKKFLVPYDCIVQLINLHPHSFNNDITIDYGFWWFCQLPYCFFSQLVINRWEVIPIGVDVNVWDENMMKTTKCAQCVYQQKCMGIPKIYFEQFWESAIIPITWEI